MGKEYVDRINGPVFVICVRENYAHNSGVESRQTELSRQTFSDTKAGLTVFTEFLIVLQGLREDADQLILILLLLRLLLLLSELSESVGP